MLFIKSIRLYSVAFVFLLLSTGAKAVDLDSIGRDPKYVASIIDRSQKVVDKLKLKEKKECLQVCHIIANRYFKLNDIYAIRDSLVKKATLSGKEKQEAILAAENQKESALYRSHFAFSADLSLYLTDAQIEVVKDAITYNVVEVTYGAQLDMIPTLKEDEKAQILAWLKEAREFAMDAESSNKKHEAFGKYKGRINNYLSKQGYDLNKEREDWYKRLKARGGKI
jgi:hypothetical protein